MAKNMSRKAPVEKTDVKEVEVNVNSVEKTVEKKPEKKEFDQSEGVVCRSVTQGGLFVDGPKTGMIYRFIDYDDTCEIEYRDLIALVRSKSPFAFHPYMVIEDEDFLEEVPQLKKFYTDQYSDQDLRAILFDDIGAMQYRIQNLPDGAKENIRNIAATLVASGQLDSLNKIKVLNEILDTELDISDRL